MAASTPQPQQDSDIADVLIVGAGPVGTHNPSPTPQFHTRALTHTHRPHHSTPTRHTSSLAGSAHPGRRARAANPRRGALRPRNHAVPAQRRAAGPAGGGGGAGAGVLRVPQHRVV